MAGAYPELATDSSDEELARDWTITEADWVEIRLCRGDSNRHRLTEIVNALEGTDQPVARDHLARISPLAHAHVIPSGTYHFDGSAKGKVATA
jgi:hypothetical protein